MDWVRHGASKREFDCFAAETWDPLLRTGYLMTGDAKDAEDLVQETLLKVARRWNRVRAMDYPAGYARRILTNLVLHDAGRRSRRRAELWPQDSRAETADQSAAQALREVDDQAEFRWAPAQLPARQRAVLVLRCWTDLPVAEVADILGCSEGTVTSTASRAAARLAEALTQRAASHPNPRPATRKGNHLMLTEELEDDQRRAFARAAADIAEPEQARQRLLQRNYRPGRGHRQLAAGITAATAAAAVVLGLGLTGAFGSAPARGTGTIRTAAFTLVEQRQRHRDADHQTGVDPGPRYPAERPAAIRHPGDRHHWPLLLFTPHPARLLAGRDQAKTTADHNDQPSGHARRHRAELRQLPGCRGSRDRDPAHRHELLHLHQHRAHRSATRRCHGGSRLGLGGPPGVKNQVRLGRGLGRLACAGLSDTPVVISVLGPLRGHPKATRTGEWQDTPDKFPVRGPMM